MVQIPSEEKGSRTLDDLRDGCGLHLGDHICWSYGSDEDHWEVLTRFIKEGLERKDRVLYLSHRFSEETALGYLREAGVAAEDFCSSGQLMIRDSHQAWLGKGDFQPGRSGWAFQQAAAQAVADGYRALRVASESGWLLPEFVGPTHWIEHECWMNHFVASAPLIELCGYDTRHSDADWLFALQAVHPHRITGPSVCQSPFTTASGDQGEIVFAGEVDWSCQKAFGLALGAMAACAPAELVLELTDLWFSDRTGLQALVSLARALHSEGRNLTLRLRPEVIRRIRHPSVGLNYPPNLYLS